VLLSIVLSEGTRRPTSKEPCRANTFEIGCGEAGGYLQCMRRLFSSFPSGAAGAGLLILRVGVAGSIIPLVFTPGWLGNLMCGLSGMAVIGLCIGMWTDLCCAIIILVHAASIFWFGSSQLLQAALAPLQSAALWLLGPGAYSIDAKRYGRRVIVLPGSAHGPKEPPQTRSI
jgi:hypothetical protein